MKIDWEAATVTSDDPLKDPLITQFEELEKEVLKRDDPEAYFAAEEAAWKFEQAALRWNNGFPVTSMTTAAPRRIVQVDISNMTRREAETVVDSYYYGTESFGPD